MSKLIVNEIEKYDAGQLTITTGTDVSIGSDLTVGGSIAGTLSTAAQTNITSVGTLSSLTVAGELKTTQGTDNTIIGANAGNLATTTGERNVGIGNTSLFAITSGSNNVAVGQQALNQITTGTGNVAVGRRSLVNVTTGVNNIGIGVGAGDAITTGSNNTIIGDIAGTGGLSDTIILGAGTTERLRIDSSGNVGIGTSSPAQKIHVVGTDARFDTGQITLTEGDNLERIRFRTSTGNLEIHADQGNNVASSHLDFYIDNTEKMRIDSSGNVGIGESDPDFLLQVGNSPAETVGISGYSQIFAARESNVGTNPTLTLTLRSNTDSVGAIYCLDLIASFGSSGGTIASAAKIVYMFSTSRTDGVTTISDVTSLDTLTSGSITSVTTSTSGNTISFIFNGAFFARVSAQGRIVSGNSRVFVGFESASWS